MKSHDIIISSEQRAREIKLFKTMAKALKLEKAKRLISEKKLSLLK